MSLRAKEREVMSEIIFDRFLIALLIGIVAAMASKLTRGINSNKYPDCGFYTSAQKEHCVAVRYHGELVGAIMPLLFVF